MKPNTAAHPYWVYTREILRYKLSGSLPPALYPPEETETQKALLQGLQNFTRAKKPFFLLLGLGTGDLAQALDKALPPEVGLIVSELAPENARELQGQSKLPWWSAKSRSQILADSSPWAHFHLWTLSGLTLENTFVQVNPELGKNAPAHNKLRKIFTAARPMSPEQTAPGPPLTVAAILSPRDPGLPDFFRQIPPFVKETVAVWDAEAVPDLTFEVKSPVRSLARPLENNFAAQRNKTLDAVASGWIFSLDADERVSPGMWDALPRLAAMGEKAGINAFYFPRQTLYPDTEHCLAGYGLWPDIQLRLFKKTPNLRFKRPVHERLENVRGPFGLVLNAPLIHLNRILKDPFEVREKLALFDKAGKGRVKHHLSGEYPRLAVSFFPQAKNANELLTVVLPHNPV